MPANADTRKGACPHSVVHPAGLDREQNSHLTLNPTALRDALKRIQAKVGNPETPVAVVASSGARYFLRQIVESTMRNIFFISHNEIPAETRIVSLGVIQ